MPARPVPRRHWRSYGNDPLPSGEQALDEPLRAFPSWFLRIGCDRCGKERMISETHMAQGDMLIRDILDRMRHDGCGGRAGKAELLTGIEGSSRPIRRIVLPPPQPP
jgi:hypothetical protein